MRAIKGIEFERMYPTPYANSSLLPMLLMALAMQKHTPDTKKYMRVEYDYIVIGSGSGGSVVASRLSEVPCVDVLVLEAGKSPPLLTDIPSINRFFVGTDLDWNYFTAPQKYTGLALNNRQVQWPSGKAVGGSSILSATYFVRGNRRDYDRWAAEGARGWSYEEVLPYFKKLEDHREPFIADPGYHGFHGPVTEEVPAYYPEFKAAVLDAAVKLGLPILDSNGRYQRGFFKYTGSIRDGQRCSAAKAYLVPAEHRPNLDIVEQAFVTKILMKDNRAIGVEIDFRNQTYHVRARREVILSAGTVNSAQLLMLSGIGPKKHLEEMKIPVVADLPVGLNLQDHCSLIMPYTITERIPPFLDKLSHPYNIRRYINTKKGPLCVTEFVSNVAFLTNDRYAPIDALPDQELYFAEAIPIVARTQFNVNQAAYEVVFGPYDNTTSIWCFPQILHPKSRGSVKLSSPNPYDPPIIDPNYFEHEQDLTDVVEGMKQCDEILLNEALHKLKVKPFATPWPGCEQFRPDVDQYYRCRAREVVASLSHPVGTVKMGDPKDPSTVVDPYLRILGVKGLRVVDASVMPIIPAANTNIPTIMVAEKASDIIKASIDCY